LHDVELTGMLIRQFAWYFLPLSSPTLRGQTRRRQAAKLVKG
jgi:hypothetical protein